LAKVGLLFFFFVGPDSEPNEPSEPNYKCEHKPSMYFKQAKCHKRSDTIKLHHLLRSKLNASTQEACTYWKPLNTEMKILNIIVKYTVELNHKTKFKC